MKTRITVECSDGRRFELADSKALVNNQNGKPWLKVEGHIVLLKKSRERESCRCRKMTLSDAIRHCEKVARSCLQSGCASEHKQLGEWLKELKRYRESPNCDTCDLYYHCEGVKAIMCENYRKRNWK